MPKNSGHRPRGPRPASTGAQGGPASGEKTERKTRHEHVTNPPRYCCGRVRGRHRQRGHHLRSQPHGSRPSAGRSHARLFMFAPVDFPRWRARRSRRKLHRHRLGRRDRRRRPQYRPQLRLRLLARRAPAVTFEFPTPIVGFAAVWSNTFVQDGFTVSSPFNDYDLNVISNDLNAQFIGFTENAPFSTVTFTATNDPGDDFVFFRISSSPSPPRAPPRPCSWGRDGPAPTPLNRPNDERCTGRPSVFSDGRSFFEHQRPNPGPANPRCGARSKPSDAPTRINGAKE